MLPKVDNKADLDGYTMLLLSSIVMTVTAGISYFLCLKKIFSTAKKETHYTDSDAVVFVLGKKLLNDKPDVEYIQRLKRVAAILENNNKIEAMVLGGKTGDATITEANAGKQFLAEYKADISRVKLEHASRNTLENLKNAIELLNLENKKIVIVSNRYHLARAGKMAKGFGLDVELCAAEENFRLNPVSFLKLAIEAFHYHWYNSGRVYAHLTNNARMIKRVGKY